MCPSRLMRQKGFFVPAKLHQPNPLIRICSTGKRTNCGDRLPAEFPAAYGNEHQGSTSELFCIIIIIINVSSSQLATGQTPGELLTPLVLNSILHKALQYSLHGDTHLASNFTFALRFLPETFHPHAPDSLNCLELRYKVRQLNRLRVRALRQLKCEKVALHTAAHGEPASM